MNLARVDPRAAQYECRAIHRGESHYVEMASHAPEGTSHALDIGCGSGRLVLRLAERVRFVIGLDLSPSMIELAQEHQTRQRTANVAWVIANAEHLPFATASFDYVTSHSALRFTDLDQSLPEIRRLIQTRGRLYIRDLVLSSRGLTSLILRAKRALRWTFKIYRTYGLLGALRSSVYFLSPTALETSRRQGMSTDFFETSYRCHFPSSEILKQNAFRLVSWQNMDSTNGSLHQGGDS